MKKIKYKICTMLFAFCTFSCSDFLDINEDPNNPVDVPTMQLLPAAQVNIAFLMGNNLQRFGAAFAQYYAGTANQLLAWDGYTLSGAESDADWGRVYSGILQDLKSVEQKSSAVGDNLFIGIAKVLRVYTLSVATDVWGDIPYSQSVVGLDNTQPAFDTQESIYAGLLEELDDAITFLNSTTLGTNPGTADLMYGGSAVNWRKAANSLKLKLHLQLRLRKQAESTTAINALITTNNFIALNTENWRLNFLTTVDRQHPMYDFAFNSREGDIAMSSRFIDSLAQLQDPRMSFYFDSRGQVSGGNPVYNGFNNGGVGTPPVLAVRARLGVYAVGTGGQAPQRFITAAQVQFMLAEAALMLGTTGAARTYYQKAIELAMGDVGVATAAANTYRDARLATYDAAADDTKRLSIVMRDKWASQFTQGIEAWTDWRRTGFPDLDPATVNTSPDGQIPVRLPYSNAETAANVNAPAQPLINAKVWWDAN